MDIQYIASDDKVNINIIKRKKLFFLLLSNFIRLI